MSKRISTKIERFGIPDNTKNRTMKSIISIGNFLLIVTSILLAIIGLSIGIQCVIRNTITKIATNTSLDSTWIGSLASYWGGIIGGVFSGLLAFVGVYLTIRYYKQSDKKRRIAETQPFLMATVVNEIPSHVLKGFLLGKAIDKKERIEEKRINISIENIGNGFANTLVIHTGFNKGGLSFNHVVKVGGFIYTWFTVDKNELSDGIEFYIQYVDSMRYEYIQKYTLKNTYNKIEIECGYPQLL